MNEYTLSVDKFERPVKKSNEDAIYLLLVRLLLLTPGTIQTHPEMGVGLVTRFRYMSMERLSELQAEISKQIATYLPNLMGVNVEVEQLSAVDIRIKIKVATTLYIFNTDFANQTIKLSEL